MEQRHNPRECWCGIDHSREPSAAYENEVIAAIAARSAGRDPQLLLRFIDAVSPFVRDVLDQPFPWKEGGQVVTWMSREEHAEAVAALEALRD